MNTLIERWHVLWRLRFLFYQILRREIIGRYKGSLLGLAWSFFNPLLMLSVYTLIFRMVFKARWGGAVDSTPQFGLILFAGILLHAFFSEAVTRAPSLVLENVNYVKKIVFPLEILSGVVVGSALFHMLIAFLMLILANGILFQKIPWTILLLPVVVLPFILLVLGLTWFLSGLGVYLRDTQQIVGVICTALLFMAPVFYPITAVPEAYRHLLYLNPLTLIIQQVRAVVIWGELPHWSALGIYTIAACLIFVFGFAWFRKLRRGFADVL